METYSWIFSAKTKHSCFISSEGRCVCVGFSVLQKAERWETRICLSIQLHQCAFARNSQEKERAQEAYINRVIGDAPWTSNQHFRWDGNHQGAGRSLAKSWRSPRSIGSLTVSRHSCNELFWISCGQWIGPWKEFLLAHGFIFPEEPMEGYCWVLLTCCLQVWL